MKKALFVLISLVLMLATQFAFADEEFTLHNGTKFGMTLSEILNKEQKEGYFTGISEDSTEQLLITRGGVFAGRENGNMVYALDDDGKLVQFHYFFQDASLDDFNSLNSSLITKYGNPDYSSEMGNSFDVEAKWYPGSDDRGIMTITTGQAPITGASINGTRTRSFFMNFSGVNIYNYWDYDCIKYAQWVIRSNDGSAILIDHCYVNVDSYQAESIVRQTVGFSSTQYELVTYTYLSSEEMNQIEMKSSKKMDDL